uniref:Uncharacterized protein n=1 Tax=Triticum urartu TaxID=4572 RepID=A0A8R7TX81_TRIUA
MPSSSAVDGGTGTAGDASCGRRGAGAAAGGEK